MAKKFRNLIDVITSDAVMRLAYRRTCRGRRLSAGALEFKEWSEVNLRDLAESMRAGSYRPDAARVFTIYEPKPRIITAASFRDRVAQHALCAVISPIFERTLLPRTYACRAGLGTHAGVVAVQADLRRLGMPLYALKTDFSKYFASIDRVVLRGLIRRKISCAATLRLIEAITPPVGVGVPIGALTSQLWANVYGGVVDRHLQMQLGARHWHRYMDDIVVLGHDVGWLRATRASIEVVAAETLHLRFSHWSVQPVSRGVNFLGYRIWPTHKLLRRSSVARAKRALAALRRRGDIEGLTRFIAAWTGHAKWADSHNLFCSIGLEVS